MFKPPSVAVSVRPLAYADAEHELNVANPLEKLAEWVEKPQFESASVTVTLLIFVPLLIVSVAEPPAPVAVFPHESSASTTIGTDDVAIGTGVDEEEPPMG